MPRNGETITPPEPQDPSREYDECGVTFESISGTGYYDGLSVTVRYSFVRDNNGKPKDAKCEYYYDPKEGFSIDDVSLSEGIIPGHYNLVCKGTDSKNEVYIGSTEVIL